MNNKLSKGYLPLLRQLRSLLFITATLLSANACASVPKGDTHFSIAISDLYIPYLSAEENAAVQQNLLKETQIVATYTRYKRSFRWFARIDGVTGFFAPGFDETRIDEKRSFPLRAEPGQANTFGVDLPQSLDGGYILAGLYFTLSADAFYRQPSYRTLVDKMADSKEKNRKDFSDPYIEYIVSEDKSGHKIKSGEQQDCVDISTPFGFPETKMPMVVRRTLSSKTLYLVRLMHYTCPLTEEKSDNGRLPPARIADAQSRFEDYRSSAFISHDGVLPVTPAMTRWYKRGGYNVTGWRQQYGAFEKFRMHLREDRTYAVNGRVPFRIETWNFFNNQLVKYANEVHYLSTNYNNDAIRIEEVVYFQQGVEVARKSKQENCSEAACQKVLADVKQQMSQPYDVLLNEVNTYKALPLPKE